jgi:hypothetical protein
MGPKDGTCGLARHGQKAKEKGPARRGPFGVGRRFFQGTQSPASEQIAVDAGRQVRQDAVHAAQVPRRRRLVVEGVSEAFQDAHEAVQAPDQPFFFRQVVRIRDRPKR